MTSITTSTGRTFRVETATTGETFVTSEPALLRGILSIGEIKTIDGGKGFLPHPGPRAYTPEALRAIADLIDGSQE